MILRSDWSMLLEFLEDLQKHVCKILGLWILYFGLYQMYSLYEFKDLHTYEI